MSITNTTSIIKIPRYTSRSAYMDHRACPRLRWLGHEIWKGWNFLKCTNPLCNNAVPLSANEIKRVCGFCDSPLTIINHVGGLQASKRSYYLAVGQAVHTGIERLLTGCTADDAAKYSLEEFDAWLADGVQMPKVPEEYRDWKIQEQRAMVEGLVRMAAINLVPNLLSRYEVLEVEREDSFYLIGPIADWETGRLVHPTNPTSDGIIFQSRCDALCRERDTGDLHIISFKTAKEWGQLQDMQFRRDVQGITEAIGIERRLAEEGRPERIQMVAMIVLIKGKEYEDRSRPGLWIHYNPITRAFAQVVPGITPEFDATSWAWSYDTMKSYVKGPKKGEQYIGRLGADWEAIPTWHYPGGVKAWIETLASGKIQPEMGDPFGKLIVAPEPWPRSDREMEDLVEQLAFEETTITSFTNNVHFYMLEDRANPTDPPLPPNRSLLNRYFPQNRASCVRYGGLCEMDGICWGSLEQVPEQLVHIGSGWKLREANHPEGREGI